ncbi:paraquat-inducible protein B [Vibrio cholerae]|nr:paraquat-inducible protein B [Vibrio cholerae]
MLFQYVNSTGPKITLILPTADGLEVGIIFSSNREPLRVLKTILRSWTYHRLHRLMLKGCV